MALLITKFDIGDTIHYMKHYLVPYNSKVIKLFKTNTGIWYDLENEYVIDEEHSFRSLQENIDYLINKYPDDIKLHEDLSKLI